MGGMKQLINVVMRYGVWSGRDYSNGWNTDTRRWSDEEKQRPGIDAHDNFVAKAHDLNEINAEEHLRAALEKAGFGALGLVSPAGKWQEKLETQGDRVLDFEHYHSRAEGANKQKVADAFLLYEEHFMRSNLQFAIDMHANPPDVGRHGAAALGMAA